MSMNFMIQLVGEKKHRPTLNDSLGPSLLSPGDVIVAAVVVKMCDMAGKCKWFSGNAERDLEVFFESQSSMIN